jgi:hypothetical protein
MDVVFVQLVNSPQLEPLLAQRALQAKLQRAMDCHRARLVLLVNIPFNLMGATRVPTANIQQVVQQRAQVVLEDSTRQV